jgi:beta-lactamase class A
VPNVSALAHRAVIAPAITAALALALLLGASLDAPAAHAGLGEDCSRIRDRAGSATIQLGIVIVDLASGARCELRSETVFRTASLYKLLVMSEAYEQEAAGTFAFDEELELLPHHYINNLPGTAPAEPVTLTAQRAIELMIQQSDNPTAHALRERLTHGEVAAQANELGMGQTLLGTDFVTSPTDIALFFERLYGGEVVSPEASAAMLTLLGGQAIRNLLPEGLPDGLPIAHKTGLLESYLHDAGIVQAPGGDYVIVALSLHDGDLPAAYEAIRGISALVYEGFAAPVADPPLVVAPPAGEAAAASSAAESGTEAAAAATPTEVAADAPAVEASAGTSGAAAPLALAPAAASSSNAGGAGAGASQRAAIDTAGSDSSTPSWQRPSGLVLLAALAALVALVPGIALATGRTPAFITRVRLDAGGGELATGARSLRLFASSADARRGDRKMRLVRGREQQESEAGIAPDGLGVSSLASPRIQRIGAYFVSNEELLREMRVQTENELAPISELLLRQQKTMRQLLGNLEKRLQPLNEYAASEEQNLGALEQRIGGSEASSDFVARGFSGYMTDQRRRVDETRDQIEQQRAPFVGYADDQRNAVESALTRFDKEIDALERNLSEQRKVLMRMLDAMRSETFVQTREYLAEREAALATLATDGEADPAEIVATVNALRAHIQQAAEQSEHVRVVLEAADSADRRMAESVTRTGPQPFLSSDGPDNGAPTAEPDPAVDEASTLGA